MFADPPAAAAAGRVPLVPVAMPSPLFEATSSHSSRHTRCQRRYNGLMPWPDRIIVDPEILAGKPIIRGTRIAVELILELLAAGQSESEILANYPGLTREDILASLSTRAISHTSTKPIRFLPDEYL